MKKYIMFAGSLIFASFALQSCLDYDDPGDELGISSVLTETTRYVGNVDTIPYLNQPTEEGMQNAIDTLAQYGYFGMSLTGQYCLRGGKQGERPGAHAYQRQFSMGPDRYAQYFTVPHKDFMYGTLTSTYAVSADFNGDPLGYYSEAKNSFMPLLHHPLVDSIPEIKAVNLLYYCLGAQEKADLSGPFTYLEDKQNSESPSEYNDLRTIYYGIVENLDTIIACLNYYQTEGNRPDWYKEKIGALMIEYFQTGREFITGDFSNLSSFIKLANSLKLRMAMHIVKVEPETAKRWAEEAVAGGVVESVDDQQAIFPAVTGVMHPLKDVFNWGDLRLAASFESLIVSLDHPYSKYLYQKNSVDLVNPYTGDTLKANTRICGIPSGLLVGDGQAVAVNPLQGYSNIDGQLFADGSMSPMYFLKWAEVDFLRAEGVLRGWDVGGGMTAEELYNRAIRNGYFEDPLLVQFGGTYTDLLDTEDTPDGVSYMNREQAIDYTFVDPLGAVEPMPSVTKIGVKWNEDDDLETKLEKIITQKYLALFPLSTEAWTELRRTGYPKLFPVLNTDDGDGSIDQGDMIRRIPWVPTDPVAVGMVETSGIPALGGPDEQATRLWWDVDAPNF